MTYDSNIQEAWICDIIYINDIWYHKILLYGIAIFTILLHGIAILFDIYGNVTDQMIHEERATLLQHHYIHDELVANIYSKIHKHTTLAEAHDTPKTDPQLISIGKPILSNARIFADVIEK